MTAPVRLAVIGAGPMGRHHCATLATLPGARLVAVADPNLEAAQAAASVAPDTRVTADHRSLLDDPSVDAVVIATPNDTHAALIAEAADAGKHVFCEKPLARDLDTADAALAAVQRAGVKLQLGFQRRFDPAYRKARELIAAGDLGAVQLVLSTTRDPSPPSVDYMRHSGGLFNDTLIHDVDSVRYLTGLEPVEVQATASRLHLPDEAEAAGLVDTAVTTIRLETGALAVVTNSLRAAYGYEVGAEVLGSQGKVAVGQDALTGLRRFDAAGVHTNHVVATVDRFREAFRAEMAAFVDCVATDTQPQATGADGRAALAIALAAQRSHREGRPVVVTQPEVSKE
jgi:inositol 2-dehydrogenase